jgi:hypothetical protein
MPSDERDRQFERALQRHMREESSNAACPEAETLAAYHERTLSLEELAKWKEHIGGCLRCQETLALVEETNSIAAHDWEEQTEQREKAVLGSVAKMPPGFHAMREEMFDGAEDLAAPEAMAAAPMAAEPKKMIRRSSWRWIAPAGALAAGLLIFVAVQVRMGQKAPARTSVQVARNSEATAPMETQQEIVQAPRPAEPTAAASHTPVPAQSAAKVPRAAAPPPALNQPSNQVSGYAAQANEADRLAKADQGSSRGFEVKPATPEEVRAQEQARTDLESAKDKGAFAAGAPQAAPPGKMAGGVIASNVAGAKKESEVDAKKAKSAGAATETVLNLRDKPAAQSMPYSTNASALRKIAATDSRMIVAPDGQRAWRVGVAGKIETTADSGQTWNLQSSGVLTELRSGSAPSEKVCWIVGKAGTILLTVNGGNHWVQIASPIQEDLGGVHAADARHASIWNVPNRKSFKTADGGVTWTPAANE